MNAGLGTWEGLCAVLRNSGPWARTAHLAVPLLGVGITSTIVWTLHPDPRVAVTGTLFGLALFGIVRLLHAVQRLGEQAWKVPALVFVWFCLVLFIAATCLLTFALLLGIPRSTRELLDRGWPARPAAIEERDVPSPRGGHCGELPAGGITGVIHAEGPAYSASKPGIALGLRGQCERNGRLASVLQD